MSCDETPNEPVVKSDQHESATWVFENRYVNVSLNDGLLSAHDAVRSGRTSKCTMPIERIVLSSTTQLVYFQALDALDKVIGCPWLDFVQDEAVSERLADGTLVDVTKGAGLDLEKIISLSPDVLLYDPREMTLLTRLEDAGVTCIPFVEYLESKPLDRVSWIDLIGVLTDKEELAAALRDSIHHSYEALKLYDHESRPQVVFGSYYQGVWSVAGAGSLISQVIKDAGGDPVMGGDDVGSVDIDSEAFFKMLAEADYIGMIQQGNLTRKDWLALDPRMDESMIENKVIFYCNTLKADYFDRGILEPHEILGDIQEIFFRADSIGSYFQIAE